MNTNKPSYPDTVEGAVQCLKDSTEESIVKYVLDRVESNEFRIVPDPENANVWGLRGDYRILAIFWLANADFEVSDELMERMHNAEAV